MTLTPEISAEIVARASSLEERLANGYLIPHLQGGEDRIERRMERWRQMATNGNAEQFEKLLAIRGLDAASARAAVGPGRLADSSRLPEWMEMLRLGLSAAGRERIADSGFRFLNPAQP